VGEATVAGIFDMLRPRTGADRLEHALRDAERYLRERQYAAAEQALDHATRTFPTNPRPYLATALLHRARGQEGSAVEAFEAYRSAVFALAMAEDEQTALLARGYERLGDARQALASWKAVLAANPQSVEAHEALARTAEAAGDLGAALEHYAWLTQYAGEQAEYQRAISRLQTEFGDLEAAVAAREAAIRLSTDDSDRLVDTFELARLHRQLGKLDAALGELSTCATLDPNWPDVQRELGYLQLQRAAWSEARRALEAYLARAPGAPDREAIERQVQVLAAAPEPEDEPTLELPAEIVRDAALAAPPTALAPIVVVFGLQGGVGRSTITANIGVALARRGERVMLLDLSHPAPDLALHLGLQPLHGLAELSRELGENRLDWHALSRAAVRHASGVELLAGCISPVTSELVTDTLLQRVLPMLQLNYGWMFVDTTPDVGERTICLIVRARLVLIVASPDAAGYQAARRALQVCETLHVPTHRRRLLWHATRGQESGASEIIAHRFPAESSRYLSHGGDEFRPEIQSGRPMVLRKPGHRWSRELISLADEFAGS
jgi:MinD-like ATPase involved in chromosome partitioning or flagellar assembly/Tfp pilus assembly protein PilF